MSEWRTKRSRTAFVSLADQLEQHGGFGLVLANVGQVVEHEQVAAVELGERGLKGEVLSRGLQSLHQFGGPGEQHAIAVLDQAAPESGGDVGLPFAAIPHAAHAEPWAAPPEPGGPNSAGSCLFSAKHRRRLTLPRARHTAWPGGWSWRKITSRSGPCSACQFRTRRSRVRRTPEARSG